MLISQSHQVSFRGGLQLRLRLESRSDNLRFFY
jgi:hypothetical protein